MKHETVHHAASGTPINPEDIFRIIEAAKDAEAQNPKLRKHYEDRLAHLHGHIGLHGQDPIESLMRFSIEYIEMAPRLIECVSACAAAAGVAPRFRPFVEETTRCFTEPSLLFSQHAGLAGLLMKAYLCHRLMEEMYENNKTLRISNLCQDGFTEANLLAHELVGEPFSNEMDDAIQVKSAQIAGSPDYYDLDMSAFIEQAQNPAWIWMRDYWLDILNRNQIAFHFSNPRLGDS